MRTNEVCLPLVEPLEPRVLLSSTPLTPVAAADPLPGGAGLSLGAAAQVVNYDAKAQAVVQQTMNILAGKSLNAVALPRATVGLAATPAPGSTVTAQIVKQTSGLQLLVLGTNGADTVTISGGATYLSMITAAGTQTFSGSFATVAMYGFGGNDWLRVTNSVSAKATFYGGAGDDMLFANGKGIDVLYGEAGNDLLVSVGGSTDTVYGGDGTDSFWTDSTDLYRDVSTTETGQQTVHRVTAFYQPYTTKPSAANYVSLEIAGQNLADPTLTSSAYHYASFASRPVLVNGAQYNDIKQGALGDCYFLASLASIAQDHAGVIQQAVAPLGDGTFAVRYYRNGSAVYLRVDGDLPVTSSGALAYAKASPQGEIWAPVMEKAYAYFRYGKNSYASIEGGWMTTVYSEVTNAATASRTTTGSLSSLQSYLTSALTAKRPVTLGSYSNASGPIVGNHAYMVKSIETTSSGTYVTVYNPWGVDGKSWDSNPNDGLIKISLAQVQTYFSAVCVSLI